MVALSTLALPLALTGATLVGILLAAPVIPSPGRQPVREPPASSADAGDSSTPQDAGPCGRDGGVDCPLQAWMKTNAGPPAKSGDIDGMAAAFDAIAGLAPHGSAFPNWASIARDGAGVVRRGRVDAARVACVSCHEQYRARFQKELRNLPLTALADAGAIDGGSKP